MSHAAFLQAIAAEPADDTARLVYADFLEETGEPAHVARAEFIRAQIEAHSLHRDDPRRAGLEGRARELFAEHWVGWWTPVCEATGLTPPHVPAGLRERVARFLGRGSARDGHPYRLEQGTTLAVIQPHAPEPQTTLRTVTFERGFPQSVSLLGELREVRGAINAWATIAPLTSLQLHGAAGREWNLIDGACLHGVRKLALLGADTWAVTAVAGSQHLPQLEDLALRPDRSNAAWPAEQYRAYAKSSLATRVRRLKVVITRAEEAEALSGPHLANLTGLELTGLAGEGGWAEEATASGALALARSSFLTGLRELSLSGTASLFVGSVPRTLTDRLTSLTIEGIRHTSRFCELIRLDPFAALTDLVISVNHGIEQVYAALADSPLAGRLRHLRVTTEEKSQWSACLELLRLVKTLDPEKLETVALDRAVRDLPEVWGELEDRFPGRVSVV
jgi:uncharacterized protein (TIGR02996 family)